MSHQQKQNPTPEARSVSFQQLKPICVKLSEAALRDKPNVKQLNQALEALLAKLKIIPVLDPKLADYTFFPLSYVIKNASLLPTKSLCLAVYSLQLLIRRGWRDQAENQLTRELVIFLTIQLSRASQDDLILALLECLDSLLEHMSSTVSQLCTASQEDNAAVIGQLIDNLLTLIQEATAIEIQVQSTGLLQQLVASIQDQELLRRFLPGTVSRLNAAMQPKFRRTYRVLSNIIDTLTYLINSTLADQKPGEELTSDDLSWRKATSSQLLLAVSGLTHLRYHERSEVLESLTRLWSTILTDCQQTLENCRNLGIETLCAIASQGIQPAENALDVACSVDNLNTTLQETILKWLQALPRKLQSADTQVAERHVALILAGHKAVTDSGNDISGLESQFLQALESSARALLSESKLSAQVADVPDLTIRDLTVNHPSMNVEPLGELRSTQLQLLTQLVTSTNPLLLVASTDTTSLPLLWIFTRSLSHLVQSGSSLHEFVADFAVPAETLEQALRSAVDILTGRSDAPDWRSQALSLEILALVASQEKEGFRTSLDDTLFPMLELLGTQNPFLRQYAIASLNAVSYHCGYTGPGDMIVQNVDYLVNAVALKFSIVDVSPQAAQVLIMMLELSGPALIPYLDDLVELIFGVLAAYHGYPRLVEVMFSVLAAIVKHGSSSASSMMAVSSIEHKKFQKQRTQIQDIPALIELIRKPQANVESPKPKDEEDELQNDLEIHNPSNSTDEVVKPPKVYTMVESVLRLSQHYLTHQEPYLRQRLLELISVGCASLSRNEQQFLPLINDVWPVVIRRVYDEEPVVSLAAMQALSAIFIGGGDFLFTRIEDEWTQMRALFHSIENRAALERKGRGGRGIFAYTERLFEGMVDMLVQLITHVRLTSRMEDDIFEMLGSLASKRNDVHEALDILNSDALWLAIEAKNFIRNPPVLDGFRFCTVSTS